MSARYEELKALKNIGQKYAYTDREVMLYAPGGSIGSLAPSRTIIFTSNNLAALSVADREAISNAGPSPTTPRPNGASSSLTTIS